MSSLLSRTFNFFLEVITVIVFIASVLSSISNFFGDSVLLIEKISTVLPALLISNFFLIFIWAIRKNFLFILPILGILFNTQYLNSVFNFSNNQNSSDENISICTYNIQGIKYGNYDLTIQMLNEFFEDEKIDIICIQEADTTIDYGFKYLTKQFPEFRFNAFAKSEKPGFTLAIFSKYPILSSVRFKFKNTNNQAMCADILYKNDTLRVLNVHFQTTNFNQQKFDSKPENWIFDMQNEAEKSKMVLDVLDNNYIKRKNQAKYISKQISKCNKPLLLCGDFNSIPSSFIYKEIRKSLTDGFRESGNGYEYTYRKLFNLFRIDYIFHSKDIKSIEYKSYDLDYSDHKPVIMKFNL